ncbi:MAG: LamG-like jellyroll fold domain-containing protein, partial [Micromonosporaceae bacterium]
MLTEHRTVEVTPSGSFIATEHLRPVRARAGGAWAAIDTTLVARNGAYVPRASTVDLRISAGGDGPLVSMTRAGRTLAFTWPGRLPAPVVDGDQAMYRSVIDGVDLIVKADSDGFSHLLRVNTAQAAKDTRLARLAFGVRSAGLRLEKDSAGVLRAVSTVGSGALFVAPEPTMWDSAGASRAAAVAADAADGPLDGSRVADVAVELAERELALVPDKGLLTGTDTVFPVYIDPAWRTESAYVWAMVSSGYPSEAYWFFDNKPDEGSGFCDLSRDYKCVKDQIKRVMFRMPISYFAGKHVISAAFTAYNNTSFSCGVNRRVDLYRVATFTSTTNWNTDGWPKYLTNRSVGYCSETPVEFGGTAVTEEIRSLVNAGSSTVSLGLKAYDETTMDYWKRFAAKAHLRVEYNTPPQQPKMSDLTFDPGGACSGTSVYVSRLPELRATLYDADMASAKQLTGQFIVLWDHDGDGTLTTQWSANVGPKTSGSPFAIQIPSTANLPQDLQAYWAVRAWDGYQWSPWSHAGSATGCYFKLNGSVPAGPEISSKDGQYPRSDPYNEADPWYPGVGRYGTFIIKSTSTDVVKYQVGINQNPAPTSNWVPDATGRAEVPLAPDHAGINYVTAVAVNNAGTSSDVVTYHFRVLAGSPSKAAWKLDEPAGSATLNDVNGAFPASVTGGVTLGIAGMDGTSMKLDGATGRAATSAPVVDTSQSFTFSAWARLPQTKPNHAAVVVGQTGAQRSAVELYYSSGYNRWVFVRNETDTLNTTSVMAMSPVNPPGATWTHLVGVYDVVKKHIRLYVNGALVDTNPDTKPWNATGSVKFGAGWYGSFGNYFQGDIDDVRIFDRIVSAD